MEEMDRVELAALVINVRKLTQRDAATLGGIHDGTFTLLSRDKAVETEIFNNLQRHEQAFVRAYAVGLGAHRAILTGFSAARMHNMWVAGHASEPVELGSRKKPPRKQWNPGTVYRQVRIPEEEIMAFRGIRTPKLFRILVEIARFNEFPDVLVAADYLRLEGMEVEEMRKELAMLGRFRGKDAVRRAIEHSIPNSDSPYEPYARGILIEEGFPVIGQASLCDDTYSGDILVGGKTVVEVDGDIKYSGKYGPTDEVLRKEKKRENRIRNTGKSVLRYSAKEVLTERARFIREVRENYEWHLKHP